MHPSHSCFVTRQWCKLTICALLATLVVPSAADELLMMSTQLDQLDRAELLDLLDKAQLCVTAHDFSCAELNLGKARIFAKSGKNQTDWARVNGRLVSTRTQVELARQKAEEEAVSARRLIARESELREAERLAQMEADSAGAQPNYAAIISGTFGATLHNFNKFNAQMNAQQQAVFRQASEARARQAEAQRNQQRAAAERQHRLEGERNRLADERISRERRKEDAVAAEKTRGDQLLAKANADSERAQRVVSEQEERRRALLAEQVAQREREQRAEETRQRNERAKADRLALQLAEKAAHEKELADFHAAMAKGIRLVAINCFGEHSATGTAPNLKEPRGGACIDVNYEATCPDNRQPIRGVAKTFVGMAAGCFGDTYKFPTKPGCDIKDVRVRVMSVQSCS